MKQEQPSTALIAVRTFLWLVFPFAAIWGLLAAMAGLLAGFRLFRLENPWPTILWLCIIALPVVIFHNLRSATNDLRRLSMTALGVSAFVALYFATEVM